MSTTLTSIQGSAKRAASPNGRRQDGGSPYCSDGARPFLSGTRRSCRFIRTVISLAALALGVAALSPLHADTYQFIISGYPAVNESYAAASSGTALATATRSGGSAASSLEARYRTWDESDGIALRSDKYRATMIIFR